MSGFYDFSDLKVGMRVNVEGEYQPDGSLQAHLISIKDDSEADEMESTIPRVDAAAKALEILGLQLDLTGTAEIKDVDKRLLQPGDLRPGMRVKTKGQALLPGRFAPEKIKVKLTTPDAMDEIESTITRIDAPAHTLTVMGFRVVCAADIEVEA
jgi:hypothetical protein